MYTILCSEFLDIPLNRCEPLENEKKLGISILWGERVKNGEPFVRFGGEVFLRIFGEFQERRGHGERLGVGLGVGLREGLGRCWEVLKQGQRKEIFFLHE
jgi:hypothetical protein